MAAYLIAHVEIHDPQQYTHYQQSVGATIEKFGGRPLVRGGQVEHLEGTVAPTRVVVVEFPSMDQAKAWWTSDDYARIKPLRTGAATSILTLVEGV